ncbi:MAG TPA: hypothetical protein VEF34_14050 [Syntrophobacteraceae bacterium]|nr:hypothetical protein [Syntrophobacteraceae bacterium]
MDEKNLPPRRRIDIEDIIGFVKHALISAPGSFEAVANGPVEGAGWCADRMPESWIIAILMQTLHREGLSALPEVRIRHDAEYFESGGQRLDPVRHFPALYQAGAKIDLFVGDESELSSDLIRLRAILEVKGPKSNWQQFHADLDRLRQIRKVAKGKEQAAIFAYVTCPLSKAERELDGRKLEESMGLELTDFQILKCSCKTIEPDRFPLVYIHAVKD